ncbi:MAG: AAA family ATPase [Bacteroidetes bacterium]|nr:AAA family ATPase [Bacteroidota bacterium]
MQLKKVSIRNFRSIQESEVFFSSNCIILLGKNEAGKSNILKAIAAVFGEYSTSDKDKRKKIENEKIEDYFVRAELNLSEEELKIVEDRFLSQYSGTDKIIFHSDRKLSDFIKWQFQEFLIKLNIPNDSSPSCYYWKKNSPGFVLKKKLFISSITISETGTTEFNLTVELFKIVRQLYLENPIKCHYWQYSSDFLLPSSISIADFMMYPENYPALENIFVLCNRENIREEFENALLEDGDYYNLLEQVSKKVTQVFQKIWKDFKGTSIQLLPDGEEIHIKVVDKAKYSFEDRSDGFKKFISILVMLSTKSRSKQFLSNDIILIDEPDQSLYPTSAQYLRDELIEIGKSAKIVYSTHSQYMIDPNCIERHLIIEKKDDITTINKPDFNSPYTTDELLKRAIGSSIFECLKPKNIIFEGYLDKKLFEKYCQFHSIGSEINDYGLVYLGGISGVDTLVQILLLANKKFIIVTDSDEPSKKKRKIFEQTFQDVKNSWLAYADIVSEVQTMEDFFDSDYIESTLHNNINPDYNYIKNKSAIFNIENSVGGDKLKKQNIKNLLMNNCNKENVQNKYRVFIEKLKETLKSI